MWFTMWIYENITDVTKEQCHLLLSAWSWEDLLTESDVEASIEKDDWWTTTYSNIQSKTNTL